MLELCLSRLRGNWNSDLSVWKFVVSYSQTNHWKFLRSEAEFLMFYFVNWVFLLFRHYSVSSFSNIWEYDISRYHDYLKFITRWLEPRYIQKASLGGDAYMPLVRDYFGLSLKYLKKQGEPLNEKTTCTIFGILTFLLGYKMCLNYL